MILPRVSEGTYHDGATARERLQGRARLEGRGTHALPKLAKFLDDRHKIVILACQFRARDTVDIASAERLGRAHRAGARRGEETHPRPGPLGRRRQNEALAMLAETGALGYKIGPPGPLPGCPFL